MISHAIEERVRDSYELDGGLFLRVRNILLIIAALGWIGCIAGYLTNAPQFFHSYLMGYTYSTTIALGALFFTMVQYLTGSAWSVPVRRFMETTCSVLPFGLLLFLPVALGLHNIYSWTDVNMVHHDHVLRQKEGYLSTNWFMIRAVIYFAIWSLWGMRLYRNSLAQDKSKSIEHMHTASRWSAPGLLVAVLSVSLASFDWIMSLNPKWYSTIFGIYVYTGGAWAFFAVLILLCIGLRRAGMLTHTITLEHFHDLGKWLFALTVFWAYIGFSQYMLIWYANIPEETIFFKWRSSGAWGGWSLLLLFGHFIIPFLVLLPRASKRNLTILGAISVFILFVHFVDHYWLVMPNFNQHTAEGDDFNLHFHWLDIVALVTVFTTYGLVFWSRLKKAPLLPVGDPRFQQGLDFVNS